ncbi:MAG: glycosyltransferase family 2 protein [bacterium]|nr:glycosyltransferase family 2 protein [bacterium]
MTGKNNQSGIVVVHYGRMHELANCLQVLTRDYPELPTVVVDNNEPLVDSPSPALNRDNIRRLSGHGNIGFAAGVNLGIKWLMSNTECRFFWVLNSDVQPLPDALSGLEQAITSQPRVAVSGGLVIGQDDKVWSFGGTVDIQRQNVFMNHHGEQAGNFSSSTIIKKVDYVPGCSFLVSREACEVVGPFPEHYFLYFEETHWCLQATRQGFTCLVNSKSRVMHDTDDNKMQSPLRVYFYNRNQLMFWSYWGGISVRCQLFMQTLLRKLPEACRALASCADRRLSAVFWAHRQACLDFLLLRYGGRERVRQFLID